MTYGAAAPAMTSGVAAPAITHGATTPAMTCGARRTWCGSLASVLRSSPSLRHLPYAAPLVTVPHRVEHPRCSSWPNASAKRKYVSERTLLSHRIPYEQTGATATHAAPPTKAIGVALAPPTASTATAAPVALQMADSLQDPTEATCLVNLNFMSGQEQTLEFRLSDRVLALRIMLARKYKLHPGEVHLIDGTDTLEDEAFLCEECAQSEPLRLTVRFSLPDVSDFSFMLSKGWGAEDVRTFLQTVRSHDAWLGEEAKTIAYSLELLVAFGPWGSSLAADFLEGLMANGWDRDHVARFTQEMDTGDPKCDDEWDEWRKEGRTLGLDVPREIPPFPDGFALPEE